MHSISSFSFFLCYSCASLHWLRQSNYNFNYNYDIRGNPVSILSGESLGFRGLVGVVSWSEIRVFRHSLVPALLLWLRLERLQGKTVLCVYSWTLLEITFGTRAVPDMHATFRN